VIVDLLYSLPIWGVGIVVVGGIVLLAWAGLLATHRLVNPELRRNHNDVVGATYSAVGTIAAVLLAFISVMTWQTFSGASEIAGREANIIANLYADAEGLPSPALRASMLAHITNYLTIVIEQDWPAQRQGAKPTARGDEELMAMNRELAAMSAQSPGQASLETAMLASMSNLATARRARLQAVDGHVPPVLWAIILLGTATAIGYTYMFGTRNLAVHMVVTGVVAGSFALVVLLIVVTDYPFRGTVSVGPDTYESVRSTLQAAAQ
jgi:hypothetical protein